MTLTKGSLCSGVGALDDAVPGELAWVAETDPGAARVLKRHRSEVPNIGDITVPGLHPPAVDVLTSGDPCQSMSEAGRQLASADERFLWPDVMRVVERVRPGVVFLENVRNLTSVPLSRGADDWRGERGSVLRLRLDDLWRAGYECRWTILGACAVGAPHHRHRWFLRGRYVGLGAPVPVEVVPQVRCGAPRTGGRMLLPTPAAQRTGYNQGGAAGRVGPRRYSLDMIHKLLPTPAARDFKGCLDGKRDGGPNLNNVVQRLLPSPTTADGSGGPGTSPKRAVTLLSDVWGEYAQAVELWEEVTGVPAPEPTEPGPRGGVRLNPRLSEWMMGYRPGYVTDELDRNAALRCIGNGVVTLQAATAWEVLG